MNKIANKFLLAGNKFKPEVYLRQPRFACSTCGSFTKNKEGIQKFKAAGGDSQYIYQKKLAFNMIRLMVILRIYLKEQLLMKLYAIRHLILLEI